MKVRIGFVSNSSSEAFICGVWGTKKFGVKKTINILQKMLDLYNDLEKRKLSFDRAFQTPRKATQEDIDLLKDWDVPEYKVKDKLIIYSKEDNTIPHLLFGLIEYKFDAERIHLG